MTQNQRLPAFNTVGRIAERLGVRLHRVLHVVATRHHIRPAARAGAARLYDETAVAQIRHELNAIDARRSERERVNDAP